MRHPNTIQCPSGDGEEKVGSIAGDEEQAEDAFADEQLVACSRIDDYFHREPIASVRLGLLPLLRVALFVREVMSQQCALIVTFRFHGHITSRKRIIRCGISETRLGRPCLLSAKVPNFVNHLQIVSVSSEGKILYWSLKNKLSHPVQG
jgi:hypothetical protein